MEQTDKKYVATGHNVHLPVGDNFFELRFIAKLLRRRTSDIRKDILKGSLPKPDLISGRLMYYKIETIKPHLDRVAIHALKNTRITSND